MEFLWLIVDITLCQDVSIDIKILEWSERGFWLHYFRLEQGRLPWPQVGEEVNPLDVTWQDLRQLLEGTPLKPVSQRAVKLPKYVI